MRGGAGRAIEGGGAGESARDLWSGRRSAAGTGARGSDGKTGRISEYGRKTELLIEKIVQTGISKHALTEESSGPGYHWHLTVEGKS
ncbi:hypothetical protein chiPu_0014357 [Chiloscyllium punctatum]|uniref:Uncharacterized protein n=1 Tax=Chiloscyllium punctatum TaxID=137246 RepID=A0A401SZR4_CHIPU|nr:hypothetical protein [Chiloscyllium punctatum]